LKKQRKELGKRYLVFSKLIWYISLCRTNVFGSILNRTAYLPRLDEGVRVRQLKMRSVHLFLLLSQGNDAERYHCSPERRKDED
jgi:hypothetical protein